MSSSNSKLLYSNVLIKGMNTNIDQDYALQTRKNGQTVLRKRWRRNPNLPLSAEQVRIREVFSDAISYAKIHKDTDFYKEEASFRKVAAYQLAIQDFHHEPKVEAVEIRTGSVPEDFRLVVVVNHPVALMELEAQILDVTDNSVLVSEGMYIDDRDGGSYSLYFEKSVLGTRETVTVNLNMVSMTEKVVSFTKSPVRVVRNNGSKTTKKP